MIPQSSPSGATSTAVEFGNMENRNCGRIVQEKDLHEYRKHGRSLTLISDNLPAIARKLLSRNTSASEIKIKTVFLPMQGRSNETGRGLKEALTFGDWTARLGTSIVSEGKDPHGEGVSLYLPGLLPHALDGGPLEVPAGQEAILWTRSFTPQHVEAAGWQRTPLMLSATQADELNSSFAETGGREGFLDNTFLREYMSRDTRQPAFLSTCLFLSPSATSSDPAATEVEDLHVRLLVPCKSKLVCEEERTGLTEWVIWYSPSVSEASSAEL